MEMTLAKPHQNMMTSSNGNIFRVTGSLCGDFPSQRPVTRSFGVFFDLRLNKRSSKQSRHRWFGTPLFSLWRYRNGTIIRVPRASCFICALRVDLCTSPVISWRQPSNYTFSNNHILATITYFMDTFWNSIHYYCHKYFRRHYSVMN